MGGLGLVHLGFLAAAAAVAVPILIHLLLRPRARRVEIGSLRFLLLALKESTRRRRLRRWLLLALRALAVLLLALLFARPYLPGAGSEGRDREAVLLIDQSASMGAVQGGRTLFAQAQAAAEQVLRGLPEHTAVHLAYFDAGGVQPAPEVRIDRVRRAGFAVGDYAQALHWARDQLLQSSRPRREVYLFTDLQRSGLRRKPDDGLPADVAVQVIEVGRPLVRNLAVVAAEAATTPFRAGEPVAVTAQVRNPGAFTARDVRVRLVLNGPDKVDQTQTVTVPAASMQEVHFSVALRRPGLYSGSVEVAGDDDFPLDDRRWLAFDARPADRLLLVDGAPARIVYGNETYYLEAALRLRLSDKGPPLTPYEPTRLAWGAGASLPDLAPYRVVALCNVERLGDADAKRLAAFVSGGGGLLIFTGEHVTAEGTGPLRRAGLMPAAVEGTAGPGLFHFATWEQQHPILRPLSDPQQGDLRRVTFRQITRLKPAAGAKVLAAAQEGEPLLVEGRLGKGGVLVFASTAGRDWTDWPQGRLYVPLVHQMVGYLAERLPENARVQTANVGPGTANPPGVTAGDRVVVRNLDPAESEVERLTVAQLREAFRLPAADGGAGKALAAGSVKPLPGGLRPDELWAYVVWALLLVLVAELFVANRSTA
ncbi:MAG TPA: BatA domain-containing protein [Gemmataceae bacterium]|nr:BatA domain-containing protein [Gemmataceae bacterium]